MGYALTQPPRMTADEFLAWEMLQQDRHQFYDGEVFAMAGGTIEHNNAVTATLISLSQHLKGTPCKVYVADICVRAAAHYFYPDVVVTCNTADTNNPKSIEITQPKLIVEVLSPSTAAFDRGLKFAAYRELASLQEYLLLDPETKTAELFSKNAANIWEFHPSSANATIITLRSVDWVGNVATLFESTH
jgi:Uma2 family endonuclease